MWDLIGIRRLKRLRASGVCAIIVSITFIAAGTWIVAKVASSNELALGSAMPSLPYMTKSGIKALSSDSTRCMVVFFHRACRFCSYELGVIDSNITSFNKVRIRLLTTEQSFFRRDFSSQWPQLATSDKVEWGIVNKQEFKRVFGTLFVPYLFFFNEYGILYEKMRGEVRIKKVLDIIKR